MSNTILMDIVVQTVLFLEISEPGIVDEDAAVEMIEQIASSLQTLEPPDKKGFLEHVAHRTAQASTVDEKRTLQNLAVNLGLM